MAKTGETWRDVVQLSSDKIGGRNRIAIGLLEPPGTFLTVDRANRD